jgi:carboxyl-terminal processing protease
MGILRSVLICGLVALCGSAHCATIPDDQRTDSQRMAPLRGEGEMVTMPTREMRAETIYMTRCMEELHYNHRDISLLDHRAILNNYMGELDFNRMILTQGEVDDFVKRFSPTLDIFISGGSLMPAFTIFDQYRKAAYARLDWVEKRLQQNWDFSTDEYHVPDRRQARWPATKFEADVLWEKRLKYELLNEMMGSEYKLREADGDGQPVNDAEALGAATEIIAKRYRNLRTTLQDFDSWLIEETFLNSLSHMYDPHSSFLSKTSLDDFNVMMSNSLVGIGAVLFDDNGTCVIRELYPGGPAGLSKQLKVGDRIVAVGQDQSGKFVDIVGMRLDKAVKLIRGKEGTAVRLKIQPIDAEPGDHRIVQLIRDKINVIETRAHGDMFEFASADGAVTGIGVITLPAFYGSDHSEDGQNADTTADMRYLIEKLKERGIVGLIIDLRQNTGGLLEQAVRVSGLFIKSGPVVQVRDSRGHIENLCDEDGDIAWDGPLIALTSSHSASASEILVGALRDHRRAIVVGDPTTHGKGSVQVILPMDKFFDPLYDRNALGAARVTVQKWYLPTGTSTQLSGVAADIQIPGVYAYMPTREADLPNALSCDSIPPAKFDYEETARKSNYFVPPEIIAELNGRVERRKSELEEFKILNERIEHFRRNADRKEISLNLEKRREKSLDDLRFKRTIRKRLEDLLAADEYKSEKIGPMGVPAREPPEVFDPQQCNNLPECDVQLRECLRIALDWYRMQCPTEEENHESSE